MALLIKKTLFIIGLLIATTSLSVKAATLLILGDSLSASYGMDEKDGWVEILRSKMPNHTIINASVSGETSAGGLRRLPALLEQHAIDTLFIELGGNDGLRAYSPKALKQNLTKMIALAKAKNIQVIVSQIHTPPNYGPRYAKKFAEVYPQVTEEQQVALIPFFMEQIAPYPDLMLRDGIHPNKKAQPKIAEILYPYFNN